ncbi:MAG: thioredoxin family protein [Flavobacterium sp.]
MKKIFLALMLVMGSFAMQAQELVWETNVNKAIEVSKATKKPLLMFFTGSDWCGWCIRLQKEVLKTPEFATWAKENVVLVELDYPRRAPQTEEIKRQNGELQMAFQIQGFPTVVFANVKDANGKINFEGIGSTGYVAGGPAAWLAVANGFLKK